MYDDEHEYEDAEQENITLPPPQHYADTDEDGNIIGFYVDQIHGDNIPEMAIPITFEEWQAYIQGAHLYKRDGDVIREKTQQELDDEAAARPAPPPIPTDVLGQEIVEKELQILDLQAQNAALGSTIVNLELRLLALEGGGAE